MLTHVMDKVERQRRVDLQQPDAQNAQGVRFEIVWRIATQHTLDTKEGVAGCMHQMLLGTIRGQAQLSVRHLTARTRFDNSPSMEALHAAISLRATSRLAKLTMPLL